MTGGFTDLHHHIVYGLDDGPRHFAESVRMVRAARADGISRIVATTHAYAGIERFNLPLYLQRLGEIQAWCAANEPGLQIYPGCEVYYTESAVRLLQEGKLPTLAGSRFVLTEFDINIAFDHLFHAFRQLQKAGFLPILAHCERYACLVKMPQHLTQLKQTVDVRFQINARTLVRTPFHLRKFIRFMFRENLLSFVATDAHNTTSRPVCLTKAHTALVKTLGQQQADALCGLNQDEIFQNQFPTF